MPEIASGPVPRHVEGLDDAVDNLVRFHVRGQQVPDFAACFIQTEEVAALEVEQDVLTLQFVERDVSVDLEFLLDDRMPLALDSIVVVNGADSLMGLSARKHTY